MPEPHAVIVLRSSSSVIDEIKEMPRTSGGTSETFRCEETCDSVLEQLRDSPEATLVPAKAGLAWLHVPVGGSHVPYSFCSWGDRVLSSAETDKFDII